MIPSNASLLVSVASGVRTLLQNPDGANAIATLQGIEAVVNELLLREHGAFYCDLCRELESLWEEGAGLTEEARRLEPSSDGTDRLELVMKGLASTVAAVSNDASLAAEAFLQRVSAAELKLYEYRMREAPQLASSNVSNAPQLTRDGVTRYLRSQHPEYGNVAVEELKILSGGFSKVTALLELSSEIKGTRSLVIRAEPPRRMLELEGMHLSNEVQVIRLACDAGLPVAEPICFEHDRRHLGMPFLISRRLRGRILGTVQGGGQEVSTEHLRALVELTAAVHRTPFDTSDTAVQRSHLNRWASLRTLPANTLGLVEYWAGVAEAGRAPASPLYTRTLQWLLRNVPEEEARPVLLHGDIGFHNVLFDGERVSGLLDWENSRIGDPAEDVSWLMLAVRDKVARDQVMHWYRQAGGPDISEYRLRYFDVYHCLKLIISALVSLRRVHDEPEGNLHLAMFGLRYVHHAARGLNELISLAEAARGG